MSGIVQTSNIHLDSAGTARIGKVGGNIVLSGAPVYGEGLLRNNETDTISVGFDHDTYNVGTLSSSFYVPDIANGHKQCFVSEGVLGVNAPAEICDIQCDVINGASAAMADFSDFDKVDGDTIDTTSGNQFKLYISVGPYMSHLTVSASDGNS